MLLAVALDVLGDLLGAAACGIFLYDPSREQLIPANSRGLPAAVLDHIPMEGPLAKAVKEQALQVPDPPWAIGSTLSELLAATPIMHQDRCLGLVTIHKLFNQKESLKANDHQLLESLGRHLGLGLVNAVARQAAADSLSIAEILKVAGIGR
jgi:GAF domain-containing protein